MKKHLAIKIILALLPAIIFTQNWAWISLNSIIGVAFLFFWILMIWQVIASEDKNYVIHRLLWLSEIGFFLLPISAIFLTLGFGSKMMGSTDGAVQVGVAIGTAIGGVFAVGIGFVVGLFGGFICRSFSKKYGKKILGNSDDKEFFTKTKGWVFLIGIIVLIIIASSSKPAKTAIVGVNTATDKNENNIIVNQPNEEQQKIDQKNRETEEKLKVIQIVSTKIEKDIIDTPNLFISLKNNSEKTIDGITIQAEFFNNFDEPVKGMSFSDEPFSGMSQEIIKPGETKSFQWNLALYDTATKVKNVKVNRAHFTDGEDLKIE